MEKLLDEGFAGSISFIYADPPFLSNGKYKARIDLDKPDKKEEKVPAYDDTDDTDTYIAKLSERLRLMRELLSESGSIAVHLDWHAVHYARLALDEIFGEKNFLNEIIWSYKSGGAAKTHFSRKHDNILVYAKNEGKHKFNCLKEKSYNRGLKPYRFKDIEEYEDEKGWYTLVNMKDVWDIDMVGRTSAERTGYATQKPLKLLERLIYAFTDEGDRVADFYGGSGSLAHAAELTGRSWISCDMGDAAYELSLKRLKGIGAQFESIEIPPFP